MTRVLSMLVRRPDLTRQAFHDHYEQTHAPLALPFMEGLVHYVRNHIVDVLGGEEPFFDTLSEFGFTSDEAFRNNLDTLASERGATLRADELSFMDKPRNHAFQVHATAELPCRGQPLVGGRKLVLLAKADPAAGSRFIAAYRESLSALLEKASAWWHWEARTAGEAVPKADVATLAWFPAELFDSQAVRDWSPDVARSYRLLVDERVTHRATP